MTRAFNWLNTKHGLLLCSVLILALAGVEGYSFLTTHKTMYLGLVAFMLALVGSTWVQLYRHRGDPTWPPRRVSTPRNRE